MDWKLLKRLTEANILSANALFLILVPIVANLLARLQTEHWARAILYIFDPAKLVLPPALSRLYVASVLVLALQAIVKLYFAVYAEPPENHEDWKETSCGQKATRRARNRNEKGKPGLADQLHAEHQRQLRVARTRSAVVRYIATAILILSAYLVIITITSNAASVLQKSNIFQTLWPFGS